MVRKSRMYVSHRALVYGDGVTMKEAKRAFLSGMSKGFKKKVRVVWKR